MTHISQKSSSQFVSTRAVLTGIWQELSDRRRAQLGLSLITMLLSGLAELGSLAAVVPFLAVLTDPEPLQQFPLILELFARLGFSSDKDLLLLTTLLFGFAAILAATIRLFNLWLNGRLAAAIGTDLSCQAFQRTLYQPYEVHIQRNSSAVITNISTQTLQVVAVVNSLLELITSLVVALGLLAALLAVDWLVACIAIAVFGTAYALLSLTARRQLVVNSRLVADASKLQLKILQEALSAIRDVLLHGNQATYLAIYRQADLPMRLRQAQNVFLGGFPKFAFEALGLLLIAILALFLSSQRGGGNRCDSIIGDFSSGLTAPAPRYAANVSKLGFD